jgi:hypothetical protein
MILRACRIHVEPSKVAAYESFEREEGLLLVRAQFGLR